MSSVPSTSTMTRLKGTRMRTLLSTSCAASSRDRAWDRIILAAVLFVPGVAVAEPTGRDVALKLRQNTVRIEVNLGEATENGFGFIVGEKDGVLYAFTANHVVEQKDPDGPPPKVRVELYDHRGDMIDAKLLGTHDVGHDLAVITF